MGFDSFTLSNHMTFSPLTAKRRGGTCILQNNEFELIALSFKNSVFVGSVQQVKEDQSSQMMSNSPSACTPVPCSEGRDGLNRSIDFQ